MPIFFAASLLQSYCSFSSLILPSFALISYYSLSKILHLKRKGLFDGDSSIIY